MRQVLMNIKLCQKKVAYNGLGLGEVRVFEIRLLTTDAD